MGKTTAPDTLSDDELVDQVKELAAGERRASAALVRSLVQFDIRRLYLREGCSSLFTYCVQVLHLSEGSAYNRIQTARAARRYPEVLEALERGDVTLTSMRMLAPHLTPQNYRELLLAARHKTSREIQELIASVNPRAAAANLIRHLGGAVTAVAPDCYELRVTITRETYDKLQRAQALARNAVPDGDLGIILDRGLTLLIDDIERRTFAQVASPASSRRSRPPKGRYIPAAVRRTVWRRDGGRCAFVGRAGRCRETAFLHFHHVMPFTIGGPATADNIELRCHAHNQHEARMFFGDGFPLQQQPGRAPP